LIVVPFGGPGMHGECWVEVVGELVVARLRGQPSIELLARCHHEVVKAVEQSGRTKVLYDVLEMEVPDLDVPLAQRGLDEATSHMKLKRAIVVPNSRLAYLARLAFGDGDYRVFYNDLLASAAWLHESPLLHELPSSLAEQPAANGSTSKVERI